LKTCVEKYNYLCGKIPLSYIHHNSNNNNYHNNNNYIFIKYYYIDYDKTNSKNNNFIITRPTQKCNMLLHNISKKNRQRKGIYFFHHLFSETVTKN
jgi:hypothetical protein